MSKSNKATKAVTTAPVASDLPKNLIKTYGSKSAAIRALTAQGLSRSNIVKAFLADGEKMIYQHVRNVQTQIVKKVATK